MINCPVQCAYCMAQKIDARSRYWANDSNRIGMNKSCLFINRLPKDPPISKMKIPWELFDGEYIGFQGITDCFWDIYYEDLKYVIEKVNNSKIRKLVLVSKIPISEKMLDLVKQCNKLLIVYSVTGLDQFEKTTTQQRVKSIYKLKEEGIDVLPIIHPYIHKVSDISFMRDLEGYISWKGFRYNPDNMPDLMKKVDKSLLFPYMQQGEDEVLLGEDYLLEMAEKNNLTYTGLKEYIHKHPVVLDLTYKEAYKQVMALKNLVVFSSSETKHDSILEYAINRRIQGERNIL